MEASWYRMCWNSQCLLVLRTSFQQVEVWFCKQSYHLCGSQGIRVYTLLLGRDAQWLVKFVSPGTTGHLCVTLTIALRKGGFMFRAGSVGRLPRFKYSLHHLLLLFPWKRHETLGLTFLICEMQICSCISLIGLLDY